MCNKRAMKTHPSAHTLTLFDSSSAHGFIYTVPEPATIVFLVLAVCF